MDAVLDAGLRALTRMTARVRPRRKATGTVRLNLGSGPLYVAPGWIGVDASAHLLVRWLPEPVLRALLRRTDVGERCAASLKQGRFLFWDVSNGIPFDNMTVETVYSSHMLEHMTEPEAESLMRECLRVLVPGGVLRIAVPEIHPADEDKYEHAGRYLHTHRSRWTWPKLRITLERAGFARVERLEYRVGHCPDLDLLENRPESLFVEAA